MESKETKDHTLTGFGDISLTNVFFVPGPSSGLSPTRSPLHTPKKSAIRLRPKASPFPVDRPLPSVIQKVMPPSPSKARISPGEDFESLVENMRSYQSKSLLRSALSSSQKSLSSIPPRDVRILPKTSDKIQAIKEIVERPVAPKRLDLRAPSAPLPPPAMLAPKPKERPLRGYGKLPRRPPLPRWDLLDPDVYNKALRDPGSLLRNMPSKLTHGI
ncbi:hypothetical protein BDZ94DRAFT_1258707 [Collybia nuda]|uniref:Uncharacterized protein n=1 Tax=Collybia nuda TaxID=64659 RepID=A0A9P5Y7D3_9AGAR|nr:hypothetical protein BDZ94DRAFT_1258707 [Collybia nuda]